MILTWFILILSFGIICYIACLTKRKLRELDLKEKERLEKNKLSMEVQIEDEDISENE